MSTLYIIGAGASSELDFTINIVDKSLTENISKSFKSGIMSNGFFWYANNFYKILNDLNIPVPVVLSEDVSEYIISKYNISKDDLLNNKERSQIVNIEKACVAFNEDYQNICKLGKTELIIKYTLIKKSLYGYIHDTLSLFSYYCYSIHHRNLAKIILRKNADVISFNWETLLEDSLVETKEWSYIDGYTVSFEEVVNQNDANDTIVDSKFKVLKPHGSINWYINKESNEQALRLIVPLSRDKRRSTVTELLEKSRTFGNNTFCFSCIQQPGKSGFIDKKIHEQIIEKLEKAEKIIIIGFSFNPNDKDVKSEFSDINYRKGVVVEYVNPDDRVEDTYKDIFKTKNVIKVASFLSEYCSKELLL